MELDQFLSIVVLLICCSTSLDCRQRLPADRPLVIAHRGSSGVLPEHTVESYQRAVSDRADVIECDVTLSRDLVPVCLHEELLQTTTDVADRPEFSNRTRRVTVEQYGEQVRFYQHT